MDPEDIQLIKDEVMALPPDSLVARGRLLAAARELDPLINYAAALRDRRTVAGLADCYAESHTLSNEQLAELRSFCWKEMIRQFEMRERRR